MADLIDRQAVIDAMFSKMIPCLSFSDILKVLRGQPSARMDARWKGEGMGDYRCSLCGEVGHGRTNYCPNCGAYMGEGGHNGETD